MGVAGENNFYVCDLVAEFLNGGADDEDGAFEAGVDENMAVGRGNEAGGKSARADVVEVVGDAVRREWVDRPASWTASSIRGWRRNFESVFLADLNDEGKVLLSRRSEGVYFLEEAFESCRGDDAHETAGHLAEVTVRVRNIPRGKDGIALVRNEGFATNSPFIIAFKDLECFIFTAMDVWRRPTAGHIVRFNDANDSAGLAAVNAKDHGDAEDV